MIHLANSLNQLDCRGELLVQCINPFTKPVTLPAGALVGKYQEDVGPALKTVAGAPGKPSRTRQGAVPEHVADLYEETCGSCRSSSKCQELAQLLLEYNDVFNCGDNDMGLTKVVCHEIPLAAGTVPTRQPTQ